MSKITRYAALVDRDQTTEDRTTTGEYKVLILSSVGRDGDIYSTVGVLKSIMEVQDPWEVGVRDSHLSIGKSVQAHVGTTRPDVRIIALQQ